LLSSFRCRRRRFQQCKNINSYRNVSIVNVMSNSKIKRTEVFM
jgi:hypothetical protein